MCGTTRNDASKRASCKICGGEELNATLGLESGDNALLLTLSSH